jgi:tetratricopeptide (TPR) repeat protein
MTNLRIILVSFLLGLAVCTISYAQSDGELDSQYFEMAYDFDTKGQYDKALEYYQASLEIERSLGNKEGIASSLNNIGSIYKSWGQYDKALEYQQASLEIERSLGDEDGIDSSLSNIGRIYHSWSQYDKAKKNFELSVTSIEKIRKITTGDAHRYYSASAIGTYDFLIDMLSQWWFCIL